MAIAKIQTGDNVKIISGNYKNTEGVITEVITITKGKKTIKRVVVSTVPTIVKYRKANKLAKSEGSMSQVARKVDISNVMLVENGKAQKSSIIINEEGKKVRQLIKSKNIVIKTKLLNPKKSQEQLTDIKA